MMRNRGAALAGCLAACLVWMSGAGEAEAYPLFGKGAAVCRIAGCHGFRKELITAGGFTLLAFTRLTEPGAPPAIYIEGDGSAWESRTRLSDDPTPRDPLVMALAAADPSGNVVYLARPGQFTSLGASVCEERYWSSGSYAETVVAAMDSAVSELEKRCNAREVSLVGYSGGGALAVLVAARRHDVAGLRTVAGNLDHAAVTACHKVSPLADSLNPIDYAAQTALIPQRHFIGSRDSVIPVQVTRAFVERAGGSAGRVTVVKGATHREGWRGRWPGFLAMPLE